MPVFNVNPFLRPFQAELGDGADAILTVAGTITEARIKRYTNVTVPAGTIWQPNSWLIVATQVININDGSTVRNNGANAVLDAAGAGAAAGWYANSWNGAAGAVGAGAVGTGAGSITVGGMGGAGGNGTPNAGGGASASGYAETAHGDIHRYPPWRQGGTQFMNSLFTYIAAGGGAAGGGDGANKGGGGGGGAGWIVLIADTIVFQGTGNVQCVGGNGGNGAAGNCGGGGGGGGGMIGIFARNLIGITPGVISQPTSIPLNVSGGSGGIKTGTGVNGNVGANGFAFVGQI